MKRLKWFAVFALVLAVGLAINAVNPAQADNRYWLKTTLGEDLPITTVNQKREADSLVLYTSEYGPSTRTNPYGVEISAIAVANKPDTYRVEKVSSIWQCQQVDNLGKCGNMSIPENGIVLSAMGNKRDLLLQAFTPGKEFTLGKTLIYENRMDLNATNPTAETNPGGSGFPGFRGGNQLIVYDANYGQPTTGTNEFGFEVTVVNGRVVAQEGANSAIPTVFDSYVLSGHGKARQWLLQNAPLGSRIAVMGNVVTSMVDKKTYLYQVEQMVEKIQRLNPRLIPPDMEQKLANLKSTALQLPDETAARQALSLKEELTPILWASFPPAQPSTPRAIWHRPSESSVKEIQQSLDLLQKAGFNTIYLETYLHGDPIFPSRTFEAYNIPQKLPFTLTDSKADLLQLWLDEAHKRKMKVHVWFQTFYAGNTQYDKDMGSILKAYPQWANIQRSGLGKDKIPPSTLEAGGYFLDPANAEVQRFLLALVEEIITRYPVDGFQLDYVRYPSSFPPDKYSYVATTWGYSPLSREIFKTRHGIDPAELTPAKDPELWAEWNAFKTRQVDRFVQRVHDLVETCKPDLPLSAAIFPKPEDSLLRKHQNWVTWAQQGWIDFLAPMTLTSSLDSIATDTRDVKTFTMLPVITGIFGPFNGNSPSEVVEQVWTALSAGATGVAMFDTAHLTQRMAEALHTGIFKPVSHHP